MTTKQPLGPNQTKWLEALRSGKYQQGREVLCCNNKFCCLGVACDLFVPDGLRTVIEGGTSKEIAYEGKTGTAPSSVVEALKLYSYGGQSRTGDLSDLALVSLNDSKQYPFAKIADIIESDPSMYFSEPK